MYEHSREKLLSTSQFLWRVASHVGVGFLVFAGSLLLGMVGYVYFEKLDWLDAFLNAAMLLGGMGPVMTPVTEGGKLFAGIYALYAGMMFIVVAGIILAPIAHRILHRFHWEDNS